MPRGIAALLLVGGSPFLAWPGLAKDDASQSTRAGAAPAFPRFLRPLPGEPARPPVQAGADFGRSLLLTFDDGPDLVGTSLVLEELTRRGLKAVFFVNGHHMMRNRPEDLARRDLLRKLAIHGHLVGNHTLNHKNLCQERAVMASEIDGASEIIAYATSVRPLLFRSPYGARCRALDRALAERDVLQVGWNMDPQEWRGEDEDAIVKYVTAGLRRAQGPVILLLHDKNVAAVRALSRILDFVDGENARVAREGGKPIRLVDYRVLLPTPPLPETGIEPWSRSAVRSLGALASLKGFL
ncbi:MAG: polysaccharide deacetylase family protein [Deltaproteobacteria bacterium]|nr:polysaccharide deacetylase family protein [Deltaproteobacteria bacterium]